MALTDVNGIDSSTARVLRAAGYESVGDLRSATQEDLGAIDEISAALAARIKADVGDVSPAGDDDASDDPDQAIPEEDDRRDDQRSNTVDPAWRYHYQNGPSLSTAADSDTLYIGVDGDGLHAIDVANQRRKWRAQVDGQFHSPPVIADGVIFLQRTSGPKGVYAVDAASGSTNWRFDHSDQQPAVLNGTVYTTADGAVHAVDARTGDRLWRQQIDPNTSDIVESVTADGYTPETVYVTGGSELVALEPDNGNERWRMNADDQVWKPTVADGTVYLGSADNYLYAVDVDTGRVRWRFETGDEVYSSPTVVDGAVYVGSDDGALYALNATDGTARWRFSTGRGVTATPIVIDGIVYIASDDLYAIDVGDGTEQWQFELNAPVGKENTPVVADETIYVGGDIGNYLHAVDLASGSARWRLETEAALSGSPIVVDETVCVDTFDGIICGVSTEPDLADTDTREITTESAPSDDAAERAGSVPDADSTPSKQTTDGPQAGDRPASGDDDVVATLLNRARDRREVADDFRDAGEYDDAIEAYDAAINAYQDISSRVQGDVSRDVNIDERVEALRQARERARFQQLHNRLDEAEEDLATGDLDAANRTFDRVQEALAAVDFEYVEPSALEDRLKRGCIKTSVEQIATTLEEVDAALEANPQRAERLLDGVADRLDDITTRASDAGFLNELDRLSDVRGRYKALRKDLEGAAAGTRGGPPDRIPGAPSLELTYDSIEKQGRLGGGGSADVYEATALGGQKTVKLALKEPRFQGTLESSVIERFEREAKTWERLDAHDFVVDIVDWGTDPLPWIAMEYMDVGTLARYVGDLGLDQAVWTALSVTKGVRHAHTRGVAHLDLKPENILLRTADTENSWPIPKVSDWGLAKLLLHHTQSVEGFTPEYAAPEQIDDDRGRPDQDTDIYQLGAVFYELFTGEPPFTGGTSAVLEQALHEDPVPPTERNPALPGALDEILLTALAKDREDRYEDILYLRDALRDVATTMD